MFDGWQYLASFIMGCIVGTILCDIKWHRRIKSMIKDIDMFKALGDKNE